MYSYEIEKLIKLRNGLVTLKEYIEITKSNQVDHVKYEDDVFKIWTTDGYRFELKIIKEKI
jgi:hypothetical protein